MVTQVKKMMLLILISFLLFIVSCSKDSITSQPSNTETPYTIVGKIENWNYGDTISIIAGRGLFDSVYIFGSSKIKTDGSFSIDLTQPQKILQVGYGNGAYTFSDPEAKFAYVSGLMLFLPNGKYFKSVNNASCTPDKYFNVGEYTIYFEYADRSVIMTGIDTGGNSVTNIHLNYKKGWNRIRTKLISAVNNGYQFERVIVDTLGDKWFIQQQ